MFKITNKKIKSYLKDFRHLYRQKNFAKNDGGMKFPHLFATYCILKEVNPSLIIESGVWRGMGTWMIEHTVPDSKIISVDIDLSLRTYISDDVTYIENDINNIDWKDFFDQYPEHSPDTTLLFLDDHVDLSKRYQLIRDIGFKYIIDEDNYPPEQGCRITAKTILEGKECLISEGNGRERLIKIDDKMREEYHSIIKNYWEFPPVYLPSKTRWGDDFSNYKSKKPLFDSITEEIEEFGNYENYTWMCLLETNV